MKTLPTKSPYETDEDFQDRLYPVLFGRNRNGTFAFGNSGGPGRPKGVHSRQFDGYEHFEPTSNPVPAPMPALFWPPINAPATAPIAVPITALFTPLLVAASFAVLPPI